MKTSLLSSNATALERAIEACFPPKLDLGLLRGFKFKEEAIPYIFEDLIAEYGLESVRLWISDPARILAEGIRFQRLRGTPAAMKMALGWANLGGVTVEEERPGLHFAEFQLGIEELSPDLSLEAVVELANHAKPVRSRLTRLFNSQYDRRCLILDENEYGDFLDGASGVQVGDLLISFGRHEIFEAGSVLEGDWVRSLTRERAWSAFHGGIFRLDEGFLDEGRTEIFDATFIHEHAFIFAAVQGIEASIQVTQNCRAKSQMVLDDGFILDSENTALGAFTLREIGRAFILDGDLLDEHLWGQERVEILERDTNFYTTDSLYTEQPKVVISGTHPTLIEAQLIPAVTVIRQKTALSAEATYGGVLFGRSWKHLDRPWSHEAPIVGGNSERF